MLMLMLAQIFMHIAGVAEGPILCESISRVMQCVQHFILHVWQVRGSQVVNDKLKDTPNQMLS